MKISLICFHFSHSSKQDSLSECVGCVFTAWRMYLECFLEWEWTSVEFNTGIVEGWIGCCLRRCMCTELTSSAAADLTYKLHFLSLIFVLSVIHLQKVSIIWCRLFFECFTSSVRNLISQQTKSIINIKVESFFSFRPFFSALRASPKKLFSLVAFFDYQS